MSQNNQLSAISIGGGHSRAAHNESFQGKHGRSDKSFLSHRVTQNPSNQKQRLRQIFQGDNPNSTHFNDSRIILNNTIYEDVDDVDLTHQNKMQRQYSQRPQITEDNLSKKFINKNVRNNKDFLQKVRQQFNIIDDAPKTQRDEQNNEQRRKQFQTKEFDSKYSFNSSEKYHRLKPNSNHNSKEQLPLLNNQKIKNYIDYLTKGQLNSSRVERSHNHNREDGTIVSVETSIQIYNKSEFNHQSFKKTAVTQRSISRPRFQVSSKKSTQSNNNSSNTTMIKPKKTLKEIKEQRLRQAKSLVQQEDQSQQLDIERISNHQSNSNYNFKNIKKRINIPSTLIIPSQEVHNERQSLLELTFHKTEDQQQMPIPPISNQSSLASMQIQKIKIQEKPKQPKQTLSIQQIYEKVMVNKNEVLFLVPTLKFPNHPNELKIPTHRIFDNTIYENINDNPNLEFFNFN